LLSYEREGIQIVPTWPLAMASAYVWIEICDETLSNCGSLKREINTYFRELGNL
jgi:hypothetical protein